MSGANQQGWKKRVIGNFTLRRLFRSLLEVYICVVAGGWLLSDRLAFQPPSPTYSEGKGVFRIVTPNGQKIAVLALTNATPSPVVLFAHGNAEDLGGVREFMEQYRSLGFDVYAFDYRGYGISDGKPGTGNAYEDIAALYAYLVEQKGIPPKSIILHGRSLGAAVALHLATRRPVGGVIVESAFLTAFRVMTRIPIAPVDKMRNIREVRKLQAPALFIHGEADRTIPIWHGKKLYALAPEPKFAYWVKGAGHNDVLYVNEAEYWRQILAFAGFVGKKN